MHRLVTGLLILTMVSACHTARKMGGGKVYVRDFNWTLRIPESFADENNAEWKRVQESGKKVVEDTYDIELKNKVKTLFIFKSGSDNFFEATCEVYNRDKRGDDYDKNMEDTYDILYKSFTTQRPDVTIDTAKTAEQIDGLEFKLIKINMVYPNKMVKHVMLYSRLFDTKELTVSIMYADETKGRSMVQALRNSRFAR